MTNIYLIGDSIRFGAPGSPGYGVYVREKTNGIANVFAPNENCRFAQHTLRYLHEWTSDIDKKSINIVHWNNGLWDALRLFGDDPLTSIDVYGNMLKRVYKRISMLFPNARVIFALSTAVIEEWANPDFIRYNHEIEAYNQKAKEVMNELGVPVNDLYSVSAAFDRSLHSDWVHFGVEGSNLLADAVIKACFSTSERQN